MKRFGQFLQEREDRLDIDDGMIAIMKMVAVDHREELMQFMNDLAVSDHRLRDRLEAYKVKADKNADKLPPSRTYGDMEEIVPSTADGVGGQEEEN